MTPKYIPLPRLCLECSNRAVLKCCPHWKRNNGLTDRVMFKKTDGFHVNPLF